MTEQATDETRRQLYETAASDLRESEQFSANEAVVIGAWFVYRFVYRLYEEEARQLRDALEEAVRASADVPTVGIEAEPAPEVEKSIASTMQISEFDLIPLYHDDCYGTVDPALAERVREPLVRLLAQLLGGVSEERALEHAAFIDELRTLGGGRYDLFLTRVSHLTKRSTPPAPAELAVLQRAATNYAMDASRIYARRQRGDAARRRRFNRLLAFYAAACVELCNRETEVAPRRDARVEVETLFGVMY